MILKPILAATLKNLEDLNTYPVYCSPKIDGIRIIKQKQILSRSFKKIPNKYIQDKMKDLPDGLDGEIITSTEFNDTQSFIMSHDLKDFDFTYLIFDYVKDSLNKSYLDRMKDLEELNLPSWCKKLIPIKINNLEELKELEIKYIEEKYEGIMLRVNGEYKCGRSSLREGLLLKYKRFFDAEAIIIGFEEKQTNTENKIDSFGYKKRGCKIENSIGMNTLGSLIVEDCKTGVHFGIGSGLTDELRYEIWNNQDKYLNKVLTYKYQELSSDIIPRFPVFLRMREKE